MPTAYNFSVAPPSLAALVNVVGFLLGTALYGLLLGTVLRTRAAVAAPEGAPAPAPSRLLLSTGVLGLVWNLGSLWIQIVDPRLDTAVTDVLTMLSDLDGMEQRARRLVARMASCLQAALLLRQGDPAVADAFCASRLGGDWAGVFGTLPSGVDVEAIVRRTTPAV